MLDAKLIQKISRIHLKALFVTQESFAGEYASAFKGSGMEFDEVREYIPGDDIRSIDWNVTARMNAPYVKIFKEEREQTLMIILDVSHSLHFGSHHQTKREQVAQMAAVLAYLAIKSKDKVGFLAFSDRIEKFIPPQKGSQHIWNIIKEILTLEAQGQKTDLKVPVEFCLKTLKRKSLCFLISDFLHTPMEERMQIFAKKHQLVAVRVEDPLERQLPDAGIISFLDLETQGFITINTNSPKHRQKYEMMWKDSCQKTQKWFQKHGVDYFEIDTSLDIIQPLLHYFYKKNRRSS